MLQQDPSCFIQEYTLFLEATPGWNWLKIKQMLSNTLRLNFCYLKIIYILHPKITVHILKNKQKSKCVCIQEIIQLIIMKIMKKMKKMKKKGVFEYDVGFCISTFVLHSNNVSVIFFNVHLWYFAKLWQFFISINCNTRNILPIFNLVTHTVCIPIFPQSYFWG